MLKDQIEGFTKKVNIWKDKVGNCFLEMFPAADDFITENNLPKDLIVRVIIDHLNCLETQFQKYLSSNFDSKKLSWVHRPYSI